MKFKLTVKGAKEMERKLQRIAKQGIEQAEAAMQAEADVLVDKVRDRTPVATGLLRDSFRATTEAKRGKVVITIGTDVPYAPYVHENLEAFHEVGDAKFLESVLDESEPDLMRDVGSRIDLKKAAR